MNQIKSYRDLIVRQKSHSFVKEIVKIQLPKNEQSQIIRNQLLRAAFSIPSNIAEGYGGHKGNYYKNFLVIARRSATEADYWLFLLNDLSYIGKALYSQLISYLQEINAMLSSMITKLGVNK